ncbi:MerR family transcriptional regulator [Streptomyces sp. NPDC059002]|uniref:MerR family transcriptional regulator n=1 Tax=Streptomyces sp. NPDC059002 TaxID=3346690 RepID=UPI00368B8C8E
MSEDAGGPPPGDPGVLPAGGSGLSIGKVAEATGLSVHALRFFEREELFLREIPRSGGGQRIYEQADVDWLLLCGRLRDSGMPIATIKRFAALVRSGPGNEEERLALLQEHERNVRAKIDDLSSCLDVIQGKVLVYEQHLRDGTAAGLWSPLDGRHSNSLDAGAPPR